jgi:hypothetical protein
LSRQGLRIYVSRDRHWPRAYQVLGQDLLLGVMCSCALKVMEVLRSVWIQKSRPCSVHWQSLSAAQ